MHIHTLTDSYAYVTLSKAEGVELGVDSTNNQQCQLSLSLYLLLPTKETTDRPTAASLQEMEIITMAKNLQVFRSQEPRRDEENK